MRPLEVPNTVSSLALCACACLAGCDETIALGSECSEYGAVCTELREPAEAGVRDAGARDAEQAPTIDFPIARPNADGGVLPNDPEADAQFPDVENASFELTSGGPGAITLPFGEQGTAITPWYTCVPSLPEPILPESVRAENEVDESGNDGDPVPAGTRTVGPSHDETFVNAQAAVFAIGMLELAIPIPLAQALGEPLLAGRRYAFELDVRTPSGKPDASLLVIGTDSNCFQQAILFDSGPLDTNGWETICVDFTPANEHTHLMLQAGGPWAMEPLNFLMQNWSLYFDNMRPTDGCAPAP